MKRSLVESQLTKALKDAGGIYFSKDDDKEKSPKGFEKFLKKTRESAKSGKSSKDEKKEDDKKKAA